MWDFCPLAKLISYILFVLTNVPHLETFSQLQPPEYE